MSFLGGAECSTAGNPLSQFTKHTQDDKSLQRDRLVGRGPGGVQQGMRSGPLNGSQDNMMNEFMQQGGQIPQMNQMPPEAFAMEQMRQEQFAQQRGSSSSPAPWASEYNPELQQPNMNMNSLSPAEFTRKFGPQEYGRMLEATRAATSASPQTAGPMQQGPYSQPMMGGYGMPGMMGMGMNGGMMGGYAPAFRPQFGQQPFQPPPHQQEVEGKGKGKMVELDDENWEEQFAQLDLQSQESAGTEEAAAAMEAELNQMDRSVDSQDLDDYGQQNHGDFEAIWRGIQAETQRARDLARDNDMLDGTHMGDFDSWGNFDSLNTHDYRDPQLGDYMFEDENLFRDVANAYDEGMRIMAEGGNLSLAALAFEAAVQKDPQHVDAWVMLGSAQAQNEKETPAIRALEQALKLDPTRLEALMGLAVSYTNEGYDSTAYRTLERWLSVKYPSIIGPGDLSQDTEIGFTDRHQLHEKVTDLFIRAAQLSPDGEHMDPDVQVGLGVLFYGAEEYAKAVDCFSAALASREAGLATRDGEVHLLWNRLGATLANSGRSEEAIAAYEKALTLRPNFVRARYNLGVSCINVGCFEEAAGHLLGALAMHDVVEKEGREKARELAGGAGLGEAQLESMISQNQSTNLFDTLRRVFSQMGRRDLAERVVVGMDVESFRGEFDF